MRNKADNFQQQQEILVSADCDISFSLLLLSLECVSPAKLVVDFPFLLPSALCMWTWIDWLTDWWMDGRMDGSTDWLAGWLWYACDSEISKAMFTDSWMCSARMRCDASLASESVRGKHTKPADFRKKNAYTIPHTRDTRITNISDKRAAAALFAMFACISLAEIIFIFIPTKTAAHCEWQDRGETHYEWGIFFDNKLTAFDLFT